MNVAIVCIGTELTRGEIVNTNEQWLASRLTELGYEVTEMHVTDDNRTRIVQVLRYVAQHKDVIICTGGLGPTSDDLTSECVALAANLPLIRDEKSASTIAHWFDSHGRYMDPINMKQADFPLGAEILNNEQGTAPGFRMRLGSAWIMCFPGVPSEMKAMWQHHAAPWLEQLQQSRERHWTVSDVVLQVRLSTIGQGESHIAQMLEDIERKYPGVTLAYRASMPEVEVKISARSNAQYDAKALLNRAEQDVRERLEGFIYAKGGKQFLKEFADRLRTKGKWLAVAESCTGGLMAQMITSEPASDYFVGGVVTYTNEAKIKMLGVNEQDLANYGAVSEQVAIQMARGVRDKLKANVGVGITGIAGPSGGTPDKPVGLVYYAVSMDGRQFVHSQVIAGSRARVQRYAVYAAMAQVWKMVG